MKDGKSAFEKIFNSSSNKSRNALFGEKQVVLGGGSSIKPTGSRRGSWGDAEGVERVRLDLSKINLFQ